MIYCAATRNFDSVKVVIRVVIGLVFYNASVARSTSILIFKIIGQISALFLLSMLCYSTEERRVWYQRHFLNAILYYISLF